MMKVVGIITANIQYLDQEVKLDLGIIKGGLPTLLRGNWLSHLVLNWHNALHTSLTRGVNVLLDKYWKLFNITSGTITPQT